MIPNDKFIEGAHDWQLRVMRAFDKGCRRFWNVVHRRGRKTTLSLNLAIREALKNPQSIYDYVAPTYTMGKTIVWLDPKMLFSYLPDRKQCPWEKNEAELYIRFPNESIIKIKGADQPDRLRGPDVNGVIFDEWALMKREIWDEIYRPILAQGGGRWAMFNYTPKGMNHAHEMHLEIKERPQWHEEVVRASESGIIPAEELIEAKRDMPPFLYDQEMECSYITEEEMVLITSALLEKLKGGCKIFTETRRIISCDPATGGDECIIDAMENNEIIETESLWTDDVIYIADRMAVLGAKHQIEDYIVDLIGIGRGTYNQLQKLGKNVFGFDSREKAVQENRYKNKRVEAWYYAYEKIRDREAPYPEEIELRRQLSAVRYGIQDSRGRLTLEEKAETKKRLGRSPDRGDAYVMGIYGMQFVAPAGRKKTSKKYDFAVDPMAV